MTCRSQARPDRLRLGGRTALAALLAILVGPAAAGLSVDPAKVDVTTYHNDLGRTGLNTRERVLTLDLLRGQVAKRSFRKLWSVEVDGQVYAQPLVLTDVPVLVPGSGESKPQVKDLVIVATQNNSVYAFDAAATTKPDHYVWQWSGNGNGLVPVPADRYEPDKANLLNSIDIVPRIGITGTPVIDPATRRLYCVTKCLRPAAKAGDPGRYVQRVHAIDLTSGLEVASRVIEASCVGNGTGLEPGKSVPAGYEADGGYDPVKGTQQDGRVRFLPKCQNQRAGLLLLDGIVYIGWSSHGDQGAYHGWLIGYDARSLEQVAVFNATPNGYEGAIWQGGVAPAADDQGNIYVATGNGPFDADTTFNPGTSPSTTNFGNSVLKLSTRDRTLRVLDYFSPFDRQCLNGSDLDLGSGGVMVLPKQPGSPRLLLSLLGKQGTIFLLDREHFGRPIRKDSDAIVRRMTQVLGEKYGAGTYFNGSIYYGGGPLNRMASPVYRLSLAKALEQHRPDFDAHTHRGNQDIVFDLKGTNPSISADGAASAILWTIRADGGNENTKEQQEGRAAAAVPPAVLYAFDATTLEWLWSSDDPKLGATTLGDRIKFSVPTIANGRVFIGTGISPNKTLEGELNAFGVVNE